MITAQELAATLDGREYGDEITPEEEAAAKATGLVVIFGASDDLVELRGAVDDELGSGYHGTRFLLDAEGPLGSEDLDDFPDMSESGMLRFLQRRDAAVLVKAIWRNEQPPWTFETDHPHSTFSIVEDGEPFCRGIVLEPLPAVEGQR